MILALGKTWSWVRACPLVHLPLGLFTGLWLIRVLNTPWGSVRNGSAALAIELAWRPFRILDDFFDRSKVFHIVLAFLILYLTSMCLGESFLVSLRRFFEPHGIQ